MCVEQDNPRSRPKGQKFSEAGIPYGVPVTLHPAKGEKERTTMKSIVIAGLFAVLTDTVVQAEIICTQHVGCRDTGMRIISGDSGRVTSQQHITSYRNGKKQRVRITRTIYDNE
jgi:hypothetical protein